MTNINNKVIAKNTLLLYLRMFITLTVSIYTSRIVLDILGVNDFGIYSIVGGVVAILGFLNTTMSGATSRFLTFEIGKGNNENLKKTFSSSLTIHILLAIFVLLFAETIGLWILNTKLIIAQDRMLAAKIVYQLSVLSAIITITQVPYNAIILAREKINIYAFVEILNVCLKLGVVYLLLVSRFDKLIMYGFFIFLISLLTALVYRIYCIKRFEECKYKFYWDKDILKKMITFSGWDLYGNLSVSISQQGINIILNIFFGTLINAASGLATQIQSGISGFSNNINMAFRPQIIKNYAFGEFKQMEILLCNSAKYGCLFLIIISFPLVIEMDFVMHLWLKEVPKYAVEFTKLLLITNIFYAINSVINIGIHASGNIKYLSFISGSVHILLIPIIYILLKNGLSPIYAYLIRLLFAVILVFNALLFLKHNIPVFSIRFFLKKAILPNISILLLSSIIPLIIVNKMNIGWSRFILVLIISLISFLFSSYFIVIDKPSRKKIQQFIIARIS